MKHVLLSGCCLGLQDCLDLLSNNNICLLVRDRPRSLPLRLVQYSPAASTESVVANIAVFSMRTISIALIAELITRVLPTGALALGLSISRERTVSVYASYGRGMSRITLAHRTAGRSCLAHCQFCGQRALPSPHGQVDPQGRAGSFAFGGGDGWKSVNVYSTPWSPRLQCPPLWLVLVSINIRLIAY